MRCLRVLACYFLTLFRIHLQRELGHCFFDYEAVAASSAEVLQKLGAKLKVHLKQEGRHHSVPVLGYHVPVVLLAEEERTVSQAKQKLAPNEMVTKRIAHILEVMLEDCETDANAEMHGDMHTERMLEHCRQV